MSGRSLFSIYLSSYYARSLGRFYFVGALLLVTLPAWPANGSPDAPLEEIVVTASLRPEALGEFPVSTTVLDSAVLQAAGRIAPGDACGPLDRESAP